MVLPGTLPAAQPPAPEPPPVNERWKWRLGIGVAVAGGLILVKLVAGGLSGLSGGSYEFLQMQGGEPVTWNHCAAIRYQVNPKGAPANWEEIVHDAIDQVEEASGFVFADRGTTVKTRLIGMNYEGNEWEPVLIIWSDRYQDGSLDGGVIGRGGGGTIDVNGRLRYVVGKISLNSTVRDSVRHPDGARARARARPGPRPHRRPAAADVRGLRRPRRVREGRRQRPEAAARRPLRLTDAY